MTQSIEHTFFTAVMVRRICQNRALGLLGLLLTAIGVHGREDHAVARVSLPGLASSVC